MSRDGMIATWLHFSPEVTHGERATGAGLQVLLEFNRTALFCELDNNNDRPWTPVRGVPAMAAIVIGKAQRNIGR